MQDAVLTSQPTLSHLEDAATRRDLERLSPALEDFFGRQYREKRVVRMVLIVAVLRQLVPALRAAWPEVELIMRADSGFCRPEFLT